MARRTRSAWRCVPVFMKRRARCVFAVAEETPSVSAARSKDIPWSRRWSTLLSACVIAKWRMNRSAGNAGRAARRFLRMKTATRAAETGCKSRQRSHPSGIIQTARSRPAEPLQDAANDLSRNCRTGCRRRLRWRLEDHRDVGDRARRGGRPPGGGCPHTGVATS